MPDHCSYLSTTILFSYSFGPSKDATLFCFFKPRPPWAFNRGAAERPGCSEMRRSILSVQHSELCISRTQRLGSFESALHLMYMLSCFKPFFSKSTSFSFCQSFFLTNISKLVSIALSFLKKKLLAPPVIKVTIHFMRRALRLCHYSLDMSFSPKISEKIPLYALHITGIHSGHLWKTALTSHVPHNTDQALADKCAGSAKLVLRVFSHPVHINCSFTEAHTCTKTFTGGSLV